MALETLKGVVEIGGFKLVDMNKMAVIFPEHFNAESGQMDWEWFEKEIRPNHFIYVRHDKNSLTFNIQNGPIKENGVNGCQVDTLIHTARIIIAELNKKFPCRENSVAITKLDESIMWLEKRTKDREKRNVEGTSQA